MIVSNDSSVINKFGASLTDNPRVIIYDHHMFIVQAAGVNFSTYCTTSSGHRKPKSYLNKLVSLSCNVF